MKSSWSSIAWSQGRWSGNLSDASFLNTFFQELYSGGSTTSSSVWWYLCSIFCVGENFHIDTGSNNSSIHQLLSNKEPFSHLVRSVGSGIICELIYPTTTSSSHSGIVSLSIHRHKLRIDALILSVSESQNSRVFSFQSTIGLCFSSLEVPISDSDFLLQWHRTILSFFVHCNQGLSDIFL